MPMLSWEAIYVILELQTDVTLKLGNNEIGDQDAERLAAALEKNSTLTTLALGFNQIGDQGAERLAAALEKNSTLTTLGLGENQIEDQGSERLAAALEKNSTLTTLELGSNQIGDQGAERLAAALEKNSTLTTLECWRIEERLGERLEYAERLEAALEKNMAGIRVLTVYWSWLESCKVAIRCCGLDGKSILNVELKPGDSLTDLFAAITSMSTHKGHWRLVFPDGRLLQDSQCQLKLSELLPPNVPSE